MSESNKIQTAPIINSIVGNLGQFINLTMMKEAGQRYPKPGKVIRTIHDGIEAINSISNQQNMLAQGYQMNQFTGAITPIAQPVQPVQQVQQPQQPQSATKKDLYHLKNDILKAVKEAIPAPPAP